MAERNSLRGINSGINLSVGKTLYVCAGPYSPGCKLFCFVKCNSVGSFERRRYDAMIERFAQRDEETAINNSTLEMELK